MEICDITTAPRHLSPVTDLANVQIPNDSSVRNRSHPAHLFIVADRLSRRGAFYGCGAGGSLTSMVIIIPHALLEIKEFVASRLV